MLWALIVGLIVGAVAKLLMPGRDPGGFLVTLALGITGALLATFVGRMLGWYAPGEGAGFVASVLGALLLLWLYRQYLVRSVPPAPPR